MASFTEFRGPLGDLFAIDTERVLLVEASIIVPEGGKPIGTLTMHLGNNIAARTADIEGAADALGLSANLVKTFRAHIADMTRKAEASIAQQAAGLVVARPSMNGHDAGLRLRN